MMDQPYRITARGWARAGDARTMIFEEEITLDGPDAIRDEIPKIGERHANLITEHPLFMVEIEFHDEPEPERFFRYGTDPSMMSLPIYVDVDVLADPMTIREIMAAANSIFVREGAQTVALADLPPEQQVLWLERWAAKGRIRQ
jgi:hypothetical protein